MQLMLLICLFLLLISSGAPAQQSATIRSYFVTKWDTAEVKEVSFRDDMSLEKFLFSIGIAFRIGPKRRLYALYPSSTHDDRVHITTKAQLLKTLEYIDSHQDDPEALQVLFIYPNNESPEASPANSPPVSPLPAPEDQKSESNSSKGGSTKSERSTYQKRFSSEVKKRDETCRICGTVDPLEGCHIVDAEAKLSKTELSELGIDNKYEIWNGVTLCANCHHKYDHWRHGIDEDGYLWRKEKGQWIKDESVNIYPDPDAKNRRKFPDPTLLKWKFLRFVTNRDKIVSLVAYGISAMFLTPTKDRK